MHPRITLVVLAAAAVLAPLAPGGAGPVGSAARPACHEQAHPLTLYVVNSGSNLVTPVRAATGTVLKDSKTGLGPFAVVATPNGNMVYVSNDGEGNVLGHTVTPIRTATNTAL